MFKKILDRKLLIAVAAILLIASMQPADFSISRSLSIGAPPAKVYAIVNDMRRWNDWSPWSKLDPDMKSNL